ncbi:MAG TPA: hypothetical protein VF495_16530 [Phenylobacterium sp.]
MTASEGVSCKFGDLRVSDDRLYSSGYRGTAPGRTAERPSPARPRSD